MSVHRKNLHRGVALTMAEGRSLFWIPVLRKLTKCVVPNCYDYKRFRATHYPNPKLGLFRSSHQRCSMQKAVLRSFKKFTRKHLCQILYFNKVADLRPATLLKKRLWHRCFPVNFAKFLRTPIFTEHLWWLLLDFLLFVS